MIPRLIFVVVENAKFQLERNILRVPASHCRLYGMLVRETLIEIRKQVMLPVHLSYSTDFRKFCSYIGVRSIGFCKLITLEDV